MLDGVNLDRGARFGDAVKKRTNEKAGRFSGLMLTTGFRPVLRLLLATFGQKISHLLSESARAPQKETKYLQQAQSWERVLHTEPGVGKAEITFKRLGFKMSAGEEKTKQNSGAKHRFVCVGG